MNLVRRLTGFRQRISGSDRNPRSHRLDDDCVVGVLLKLVVDRAGCVADIDARDPARLEHAREFVPRRGKRRVHRLEGCVAVACVEMVADRRIEIGEEVVPEFDHRVRWRRDHEIGRIVGERQVAGVADRGHVLGLHVTSFSDRSNNVVVRRRVTSPQFAGGRRLRWRCGPGG